MFSILYNIIEMYIISFILFSNFLKNLFCIEELSNLLYYYSISFNNNIILVKNFNCKKNVLNLVTIVYYFWMLLYFIFIIFIVYMTDKNKKCTKIIINSCSNFISKITNEVEKELINIDDVYLLFVIFFIVFGWFFLLCIMPTNTEDNIISYCMVMLPFMCVITFTTPIFILYDQGIFFLTYLRGTSSTSIFIIELIYDYLSILIMFIRIIIQNLRFLFMFLVYFELQEHIEIIPNSFLFFFDPFIKVNGVYLFLWKNIKWFIIYKIPVLIFMSLYYIIHLYVIFISNTLAYVFLVFWLYLVFYSCFYSNKFENFFKNRYKHKHNN